MGPVPEDEARRGRGGGRLLNHARKPLGAGRPASRGSCSARRRPRSRAGRPARTCRSTRRRVDTGAAASAFASAPSSSRVARLKPWSASASRPGGRRPPSSREHPRLSSPSASGDAASATPSVVPSSPSASRSPPSPAPPSPDRKSPRRLLQPVEATAPRSASGPSLLHGRIMKRSRSRGGRHGLASPRPPAAHLLPRPRTSPGPPPAFTRTRSAPRISLRGRLPDRGWATTRSVGPWRRIVRRSRSISSAAKILGLDRGPSRLHVRGADREAEAPRAAQGGDGLQREVAIVAAAPGADRRADVERDAPVAAREAPRGNARREREVAAEGDVRRAAVEQSHDDRRARRGADADRVGEGRGQSAMWAPCATCAVPPPPKASHEVTSARASRAGAGRQRERDDAGQPGEEGAARARGYHARSTA